MGQKRSKLTNPQVGHTLPFCFGEGMRMIICYFDGEEELAYVTDHLGLLLTTEETQALLDLIERYHDKHGPYIERSNREVVLNRYYAPLFKLADKKLPEPQKESATKPSYKQAVYVIRETGNGVCKIGFVVHANGVKKRMAVFQAHSPQELYIWRTYRVYNGRALEQHLLSIFAEKKMRGEWFDFTEDDYSRLEAEVEDWIYTNEFD